MAEKRPKRRNATSFPKGNGAGRGDGWGGPARGASASRIKPGDPDGIQAMGNDPVVKAAAERRGELVREHLFSLALGAARQETQVAASVAYLDRTEGKPMQRVDATSKGERIGYVIAAPDEDESPDAWQARQDVPTLQ